MFSKKILGYNLGCFQDDIDKRDFRMSASIFPRMEATTTLKTFIDYAPQMSPVKDQGWLGSCVGFAVTAVKEWQEQQEHLSEVETGKYDHRKDKPHYDLSEQWLYYKCKEIDPWPNEEGTSIRYAMKVLNQQGIPIEDGWEYNDRVKGNPKEWAKWVSKWNTIGSYYRIWDLNQLKIALQDGPVAIGVAIFQEFQYVSSSGIIQYPRATSQMLGGHAVCAVGYDDVRKLIKFKNSWGTNWGQNGYGYLQYNYINNYMWDAWVAVDHAVTQEMYRN